VNIKANVKTTIFRKIMTKQYYLNHSKIDVLFKQNKDDFCVTEVPLYEFSGQGEHLVFKIRKKDLATWDAIEILAKFLGCRPRDIGYAGLKDKNALTIQSLSIHKQYEEKLKSFTHANIKILTTTYHDNKIKIGHLKGNSFFIRLKRVTVPEANKIEQVLKTITQHGIPNYFGFQRFGIDGDNYKKGKEIIDGQRKEKRRNLSQMYVNAYQSYLFNTWLSKRIEVSKLVAAFEPKEIFEKLNLPLDIVKAMKKQAHPFKILPGDLMSHYPYGRIFHVEDLDVEAEKFNKRDRVATGLLAGKKVKKSVALAYNFEEEFDEETKEDGTRRFAWIFPSDISSNYKEEKNWFELQFFLPKGSYATEVISELIH